MSDIRKMLSDFESRKSSEQAAYEAKRRAEDELASKTVRIIEAIILPALSPLAEQIRSSGFYAEVKERTANTHLPGIALELKPYKGDDQIGHVASSLAFTQTAAGSIEVRQDIRSKNGSSSAQSFAIRETWPLAEVSEQKVIARAHQFIGEVLQAN